MSQYQVLKSIQSGKFTVELHEQNHGCFEHNTLGDECGGELWFETISGATSKLLVFCRGAIVPFSVMGCATPATRGQGENRKAHCPPTTRQVSRVSASTNPHGSGLQG